MPAWTATCGSSPTNGPATATPTSRSPRSPAATSAGTTKPGKTAGYSATATAAPTCPSSPGPRSSGIRWSGAGHPPMTPPRPATGPNGAANTGHRSIAAPPTYSAGKTAAARSAETCSCTPTANHKARKNGNSGTAPPARRSPGTSSHAGGTAHRTAPVSYTHTANAGPPAHAGNQHPFTPEPPMGLARAVCVDEAHARFLGAGRSNASRLPGRANHSAVCVRQA
jgi:hypothetical protein